ncbi:MAG: hypothetical protein L0H73_07815 [Nitrococcus sp.]|nr:hypothetical protein [Nitrococcus sp.]
MGRRKPLILDSAAHLAIMGATAHAPALSWALNIVTTHGLKGEATPESVV